MFQRQIRNLTAMLALAVATLAATPARADIVLNPELLREYRLPGAFELGNAQLQVGAAGSTILSSTVADGDDIYCGIVIATDDGADLLEYRHQERPTSCAGVTPHPDGGFFLRGANADAQMTEVTGFTAYIGADRVERWKILDQTLVDALGEPQGTGEFFGEYLGPHPLMAYSAQLDKLLAFTVGGLNFGQDVRQVTQAHVIDVDSGQLTVSGQTFGSDSTGSVGGAVTRSSDGNFIIYFFSNGAQGAFFYEYDGRSDINFFKPRGEDWDDRFVQRMIYERDLLNLLWTPSAERSTVTRISAVTDTGAELYTVEFESEYTTADGLPLELGVPAGMWIGTDWTLVLYSAQDVLWVRAVDINGESPGVGPLVADDFPPVGIVNDADGNQKLLTFDEVENTIREYTLTVEDVADFDPDAGFGDAGPTEEEIRDRVRDEVIDEVSCCSTVRHTAPSDRHYPLFLLAAAFGVVLRRRFQRNR
jgi:hypothetical protein